MAITVPLSSPEVAPEPGPEGRIQPSADAATFGFNEQVPQASQRLLGQAGEVAAFEKLRADQIAVQDHTSQLSEKVHQILYDPEGGVLTRQGKNALGAPEDARSQFQKAVSGMSDDLHGEVQKGAFNKQVLLMGQSMDRAVQAHVAQQIRVYDTETFKSLLNNEQNAAATSYGDPKRILASLGRQKSAIEQYATRNGMGDEWQKDAMMNMTTRTHVGVIDQMLSNREERPAKAYYTANKDEIDSQGRDHVDRLFEVIPKQQKAEDKAAQADFYKGNMRQAMLDMFDGKLTLSEAQRRFRNDDIDKSDYDILASRLSKPDAEIERKINQSDPETFNQIREAQLRGSKTPGEIQRMIAEGAASKDITPEDGKYLLNINSERPPTPNDTYVDAQAKNVRDFGDRYFAEKNWFGMEKDKDKTSAETESLVHQFYQAVDKAKANGEDVDEIRDQVKKTAMQKRYPGLGNLDKAPDIVIDVKGRVTRLLSPDEHSGLKPKYRIVPASTTEKEES